MLRKFTKHLSYANVMASIAVFAVLGGGAFAAAKLKKDSVGSKQLKANAVKTADIKDGAVTTPKLADNAATGAKVDESSLGQVPSAASAQTATNAENATNATNAQNASLAADSTLFAGRSVTQVRGRGDGEGNSTQNTLSPAATFEQLVTEPTSIPSGGATLVVTASVTLSNITAGESSANCEIRDDDGAISQQVFSTILAGDSVTVPVVGFKSYPTNTAFNDPEDIGVFCSSPDNNTVRYERGDVGIVVSPIGG